jgi:Skp family chaperone for outer membrane proteins
MNQTSSIKPGWLIACVLFGCLGLLLSCLLLPHLHAAPEAADSDSKQLPPSVIAVVDIGKVFNASTAQATRMKDLKADIDTFEASVKTVAAELKDAEEKRKLLPAGSDEAAQAELQSKQQVLTMQTKIAQKKAEFLKREGEIYFDTYAELERAIKLEARKRGVTMVLRQGNETMNRGDRETVLKGVNRAILFTQEQYDLTEAVIKSMNGG